jgi:hypothetical protein
VRAALLNVSAAFVKRLLAQPQAAWVWRCRIASARASTTGKGRPK